VYLRSTGRSLTEQRNVCEASRDFQAGDSDPTFKFLLRDL